MDGHVAAGRRGREGIRRERAGGAGEPRVVRVPFAFRAGVEYVARRRCAVGRGEVAGGDGGVPEDARHDPERSARLLGGRRSPVRETPPPFTFPPTSAPTYTHHQSRD